MNASQELKAGQLQGIILTGDMKQAIAMLQMNCTELRDYVNEQLNENPVLERDEHRPNEPDSDILKISWSSYVKSCSCPKQAHEPVNQDEDNDYTMEKYAHSDRSYHEMLDIQFSLLKKNLSRRQIRIGLHLLSKINDDGYLFYDLDDMAEELCVSYEEIETVLTMIQQFHPSGTGARSVPECLYLQLTEEGDISDSCKTLLFSYLEDLSEHHTKKIERETGIPEKTQLAFLSRLKGLHPRPGSRYAGSEKTHYIIPDGCIRLNNDTINVTLNNAGTPALIINPDYRKYLDDPGLPPETRDYLSEKYKKAQILLKNIESRKDTIEKIASEIALVQKEYLFGDSEAPKPLSQKQIAQKTGYHESTISRTVRGKYFSTPRGTLELQSLFCSGYSLGDQTISVESIKNKIRLLIEKEDPSHPLTDQNIAELVSAELASIARRTVAKYREELGIVTATKRRRKTA